VSELFTMLRNRGYTHYRIVKGVVKILKPGIQCLKCKCDAYLQSGVHTTVRDVQGSTLVEAADGKPIVYGSVCTECLKKD